MGLDKGDFVYITALSNQLFMGSDENGFPTEPERDGVGNWHILGSLVAAPKPRLKKLLHQLAPVQMGGMKPCREKLGKSCEWEE